MEYAGDAQCDVYYISMETKGRPLTTVVDLGFFLTSASLEPSHTKTTKVSVKITSCV